MKKIDAHRHLGLEHIERALVTMDQNDVEYSVNARLWEETDPAEIVRESNRRSDGRIVSLVRMGVEDFGNVVEPVWVEARLDELRRSVDAGARGLKVSKRLGLYEKYPDGGWVRVDDERFDPIWAECGKLGVPVLLHTADPIFNWLGLDEDNPRAQMLREHPDVWFGDGNHFGRLELLAQRDAVLARHPDTVFVNAHWGCYPENLDHLVSLFERFDNFYIDGEVGALTWTPPGQQHKSHREVVLKYIDRVLYGTDLAYWPGQAVDHPWDRGMYQRHARFFEAPEDGGLDLPPDALKKFYYDNAAMVYGIAGA
jgi:predicted TIM-barrel fold metal-dependent hydrolase